MISIVLHIPHSSMDIPADVRNNLLLDREALDEELLRMTDRHTDQLFDIPQFSTQRVIFPVSRLVVDPERFADDSQEPMAEKGMGVIYEKTSNFEPLRKRPSGEERRGLIERYYHPHHQRLTDSVKKSLLIAKRCLIIDCHSFPLAPLPYEHYQSPNRPDICIGTDDFHTPVHLAAEAVALFEKAGFRTAVNRPFAGAIVPIKYYCRDPAVASIMIEVNRGLYMDEKTGGRLPVFEDLRLRLSACLTLLAEVFDRMRRTT